jgi:hypothetical protein
MGLDIYFEKKISKEIGYFRKVNFLVKFFEERGFDVECQTPLRIDKNDAEELLDCCNKVLENHDLAEELLPTMEGFFFGSTEYDEYYFDDVQDVKDYIEQTLIPAFEKLEINEGIYFSTWY